VRHFNHHIGDYAAATQHLSFVEDAAYHRMMRLYYQTEKPLLSDLKGLARVLGARTKEEKEAVATVAGEFFSLESDGWHQRRCDAEIVRYREKSQKASEAGRKGGRPRKEAKPLENNDTGKAFASDPENEPISNKKPTTQPSTLNPQPIKKEPEAAAASSDAPREPDGLDLPPFLDRSVDQAFAGWAALAAELAIPDVGFLNTDRRSALHARLHEIGGLQHWPDVLGRIRDAEFFREPDGTPKRWLNLGWLLKPENFTGLMEGRYAERHDDKRSGLDANLAALAEFGRAGAG
jgi:uncharacterized protein YdaU (DUF1376 family)